MRLIIGQWAEQEKAFRMTADGTDLAGGKQLYYKIYLFNIKNLTSC